MLLLGTITNSLLIIIGSILGLTIIKKINQSIQNILFDCIGVFTIFIGFKMVFQTTNPLSIFISLILGIVSGNIIKLDLIFEKINNTFSDIIINLKNKNKNKNNHDFNIKSNINFEYQINFSNGLITSFLLFCIGSMTIIGAMEEGINKNSSILITKSVMDGISSIILSSSFGIGVFFSFIPVFLFQGLLTLFFYFLGNFIPQNLVLQISSTGGLILILLGFNLMKLKDIKIVNCLPSLLFVIPIDIFLSFLINILKINF